MNIGSFFRIAKDRWLNVFFHGRDNATRFSTFYPHRTSTHAIGKLIVSRDHCRLTVYNDNGKSTQVGDTAGSLTKGM